MSAQQGITFLIVIVAGAYLGRNFVRSARAFFSAKGGCATGCGKCEFARQVKQAQKAAKGSIIPLQEVHARARKS